MKVYCIITDDRHSDSDVRVYIDKDMAVRVARWVVKDMRERYDEDERADFGDSDTSPIKGWIYYGDYSCEGDSIRVVERNIIVQQQEDKANEC